MGVFADDNSNIPQRLEFYYNLIEKIVEKGENDGYRSILSSFHNVCKSLLPQGYKTHLIEW